MVLVFSRIGKSENSYVLIDTDKKHFKYFKGVWHNPAAIIVKSEKDLNRIMDKARDDGYALKIGGV